MPSPLRPARRPVGPACLALLVALGSHVPATANALRFLSPTHPVSVPAATARVWSLDRDRDGDADLLFEDRAGGRLSWIESLGRWEFGSPLALDLFASPAMLFMQVDRDHSLELIAVEEGGRLVSRDVRPNGSFGPARVLRREPCGPLLAAGDVDGDGLEEILTVDPAASKLIVLGRSVGVAWIERQEIPLGDGIAAIAVGDLDGDRRAEIAVARPGAGVLHVVRRSPRGEVTREDRPLRATTHAVVIGDVDGDGEVDLVTAHNSAYNAQAGLCFSYGVGHGQLAAESEFPTLFHGPRPRLAAGDIDGDGAVEVVLPDFGLVAHVGRSRPPVMRKMIAHGAAADCAIGDFDGDGARDVALGSLAPFGGAPETRWFRGHQVRFIPSEGGRFPLELPKQGLGGSNWFSGVSADFNLDDEDDFATTIGDQIVVLLSRGRGREPDRVSGRLPWAAPRTGILPADLNGDGIPDLVARVEVGFPREVAGALGAGDGTFTPWIRTPTPAGVDELILADLDGDGREDLVVEDRYPAEVHALRIFRGLGNGEFVPWTLVSTPGEVVDLAASRAGDGPSRVAVLQQMLTGRREPPWCMLQILSAGGDGHLQWSGIHRFEFGAHAVRPIARAGSDDFDWIVMGTSMIPPWSTWVFPGWLVRTTPDGSHTLDSLEAGELMLWPPVIADFDNDGVEDVAYSADHAEFDVVRGTRRGLDHDRIRVGTPDFAWPLAGDFDGDGRADLLAQQYDGLTWLWNDGIAPPDRRRGSTMSHARDEIPPSTSGHGVEIESEVLLRIGTHGGLHPVLLLSATSALGPLRLDAFDVRGRQVAGATLGPFSSGTHRIPMDDLSGRHPMSPGLYFVRVRGQGVDRTLRWIRL